MSTSRTATRITICGIPELGEHSAAGVTHVLSILGPNSPDPPEFAAFAPHRRLILRFHDVIEPQPDQIAPTREDVERLFVFDMRAAAERRATERRREPSRYVFPARIGDGPTTEIKTAWAGLCRAAQLDGVRLHDLQHTYASVLASAGLSLPVIGALLGHTQPGTTARYAHLFDDPLRAAAERVGAIMTGADKASGAEVVPIGKSR